MNKLIIKNRAPGGTAGSPTGTGYKAGEVAINFSTSTPEFWAYDGSSWKAVNPASVVSVANVALTGGTAGSATGIAAAYGALATKPTESVVICTFAGTAYIKTGVGTSDADFAALGSATPFASAAEVATGTNTAKAISPKSLADNATDTPSGASGTAAAADSGKWVRLDAAGKIASGFIPDPTKATAAEIVTGTENAKFVTPLNLKSATRVTGSGAGGVAVAADSGNLVALGADGKISPNLLPATPTSIKGGHDFTVAPLPAFTGALTTGDYYFSDAAGTVAAGYIGIAGQAIQSGDMVVWNGSKWSLIPNETDLSAYLPLAGGSMTSKSSKISWPAATPATPEVYLDLNGGLIDGTVINCGTF